MHFQTLFLNNNAMKRTIKSKNKIVLLITQLFYDNFIIFIFIKIT